MAKAKTAKTGSGVQFEVFGVVALFLGLFLLLTLLSYNHSDPSFFSHARRITTNYGGKIGANLAEGLVQIWGLASFLVCAITFSLAFGFLRALPGIRIAGSVLWQLAGVIACATFLSLALGAVRFGGTAIPSGGILGGWIAGLLVRYLNTSGAILVTLCLLFVIAVFATPLSASALLARAARFALVGARLAIAAARAARNAAAQASLHAIWHRRKVAELIEREGRALSAREAIPKPMAPKPGAEPDAPSHRDLVIVPPVTGQISAARPAGPKPSRGTSARERSAQRDDFALPPLDLLAAPPPIVSEIDRQRIHENAKLLEAKLHGFEIEGSVTHIRAGPVITMYEFKPGPTVKVNRIANLESDLAMALSAQSVRIIAPLPGRDVVGIEIPNATREKVFLRQILATDEFQGATQGIPLPVGKDIFGSPVVTDLARMPHLLIAGAPGAGKSVFLNSLICSLLYKFTPKDLKMVMVDPKQLELNLYDNIPHLLLPVVDDPKKASTALKWAVNEMERRYKIMAKGGVRNIAGFNEKLEREGEKALRAALCPEDAQGMPDPSSLSHLFETDEKGQPRVERLPVILVIIDEFADLMAVASKDIEMSVQRLAQKARAAGIHLVIATQRPSVDVCTGTIKGNLPSRISFQVPTKADSRVILDQMGAETLLGQGDMLFVPPGIGRPSRFHGAYVGEDEIVLICDHWRKQGAPVYQEEILLDPEESFDEEPGEMDPLYEEAVEFARREGEISASRLQRVYKVGYNRAARMVDMMEAQGVVGPGDGAKPREVLR